MIVVHVDVAVTEGSEAAFRRATTANAQSSLREAGVIRFDVLEDSADPRHFVLVEVYRDETAAAAHKTTAHYATWRDEVAEMMSRPRTSVRYAAAFPSEPDRWRTAPGAAADTMGWDG